MSFSPALRKPRILGLQDGIRMRQSWCTRNREYWVASIIVRLSKRKALYLPFVGSNVALRRMESLDRLRIAISNSNILPASRALETFFTSADVRQFRQVIPIADSSESIPSPWCAIWLAFTFHHPRKRFWEAGTSATATFGIAGGISLEDP